MIYSIFPEKDTTIYELTPYENTGIDQILELKKDVDANYSYASRMLVKYDLSEISSSIVSGAISSPTFYLNLYISEVQEIPFAYTVYVYPVSQSWEMGTGRKNLIPQVTSGSSWYYRNSDGTASAWATGSYNINTTGSYNANPGGGTWYYNVTASQYFEGSDGDIRLDVTNIINNWLDGTIENQGFILKLSDINESNRDVLSNMQFFSNETHTIFPPRLEVAWDDSSYTTGSFNTISDLLEEDIVIYTRNLKSEYFENAKINIKLSARDQFPSASYVTSSDYLNIKYLPSSSYYSIVDMSSHETIIPFDTSFTKISCNSNGNYFKLWMDSLFPERLYKCIFRIDLDEEIEYFDNNYIFKIRN